MVTWLVNWGVLSLSNHEQFIRKSCNHQRFVKFFILYWSLDDKKLHHLIIKHNLLGYHNHKEYMIKRLFKIAEKWSFKHLLIIKLLVEYKVHLEFLCSAADLDGFSFNNKSSFVLNYVPCRKKYTASFAAKVCGKVWGLRLGPYSSIW